MGTEFTFTQGMKGLSNPLAAWSAKKGYKGLKKNLYSSTIPAKDKIRDHLCLVLASSKAMQAMETAAWIAAETAGGQGFSVDPAEKVAIEMRAMAAARSYYAKFGWLEDAADPEAYKHNSFDLILHRNSEVKHVEVKGTTQKTTDSLDEFTGVRYGSYALLADKIRRSFTHPAATLRELFSRIVFNILVGNTDDHPRNHAAFVNADSSLTLTPAYDICHSRDLSRRQTRRWLSAEAGNAPAS